MKKSNHHIDVNLKWFIFENRKLRGYQSKQNVVKSDSKSNKK